MFLNIKNQYNLRVFWYPMLSNISFFLYVYDKTSRSDVKKNVDFNNIDEKGSIEQKQDNCELEVENKLTKKLDEECVKGKTTKTNSSLFNNTILNDKYKQPDKFYYNIKTGLDKI